MGTGDLAVPSGGMGFGPGHVVRGAIFFACRPRMLWFSPMKKASRMAAAIRKRALSYPLTREDFPWGESAFKVKDKTFVFMHDGDDGVSFSVKLPASRDLALAMPGSEPTHYGLGSKGWVTVRPTSKTSMAVLAFLIDESFRSIAPKKVVDSLGPPPRLP
jgi:predicted DNA-binding protein (MmcQ/YjbR family)